MHLLFFWFWPDTIPNFMQLYIVIHILASVMASGQIFRPVLFLFVELSFLAGISSSDFVSFVTKWHSGRCSYRRTCHSKTKYNITEMYSILQAKK